MSETVLWEVVKPRGVAAWTRERIGIPRAEGETLEVVWLEVSVVAGAVWCLARWWWGF